MPEPSAVRPLPHPEKLFSEEDVLDLAIVVNENDGIIVGDDLIFSDCSQIARAVLDHLAAAGRLLSPDAERHEEWGVRVNEPHPRREEVVGDVIKLTEEQARYGPTIWPGWSTVKRTVRAAGPWAEVDRDA